MEKKSQLQFKGYKINNSHINIGDGDISSQFNIEIDRDSVLLDDGKSINVFIKTSISDHTGLVKIFVEMVGYFEFDSKIDEVTIDIFTKVSAPAILFPYVRAYIGALSSLSGINPIVLPTLNLADKL